MGALACPACGNSDPQAILSEAPRVRNALAAAGWRTRADGRLNNWSGFLRHTCRLCAHRWEAGAEATAPSVREMADIERLPKAERQAAYQALAKRYGLEVR